MMFLRCIGEEDTGFREARHADLLASEHDVFRVEVLTPVPCRDYSKAAALRAPLTGYNSCVTPP
jgi:hypothetical protein